MHPGAFRFYAFFTNILLRRFKLIQLFDMHAAFGVHAFTLSGKYTLKVLLLVPHASLKKVN